MCCSDLLEKLTTQLCAGLFWLWCLLSCRIPHNTAAESTACQLLFLPLDQTPGPKAVSFSTNKNIHHQNSWTFTDFRMWYSWTKTSRYEVMPDHVKRQMCSKCEKLAVTERSETQTVSPQEHLWCCTRPYMWKVTEEVVWIMKKESLREKVKSCPLFNPRTHLTNHCYNRTAVREEVSNCLTIQQNASFQAYRRLNTVIFLLDLCSLTSTWKEKQQLLIHSRFLNFQLLWGTADDCKKTSPLSLPF